MKKIIGLAAVAALALSGCSSNPTPPIPAPTAVGTSNENLEEATFVLSDGRKVTCIIYDRFSGYGGAGGLSCDWASVGLQLPTLSEED